MSLSALASFHEFSHGKVYHFSSDQINTTDPHNFICVYTHNKEFLLFTCCTSQRETIERYIAYIGYDPRTMPYIKPNKEENGLTLDTYVNCNQYYKYTYEKFSNMFSNGEIEFRGQVSDVVLSQLHEGLTMSEDITQDIKNYITTLM